MKKVFYLVAIGVILILGMANLSVAAVNYPTRPITLILSVELGGVGDRYARAFGSVGEKLLGQPFVLISKPGAGGQIAYLAGLAAPPDGHTLNIYSNSSMYPILWETANGRKPDATLDDFIPIASFNFAPYVVAVAYDSPWKTLADLINDAKAKPGHYAFSSGGKYHAHHVAAELVIRAKGLKFRHVPFAGGGPALTALLGGHVDWSVVAIGNTIPLMRGNKLRILAVLSDKRWKHAKDVPTAKELGVDVEFNYFASGILAPKKTTAPIVEKLIDVSKKVARDESFIKVIEGFGDEVYLMQGEELARFLNSEKERANKLFKQIIEEERK